MRAALRNSYVDYVIYMGVTEKYPAWFRKILDDCTFTDESRFTFWVDRAERRPDYYEKKLIETHSVLLRKPNGEVHITDYDTFQYLYIAFTYDGFTNSGIAAYEDDSIEYVECKPGMLSAGYPSWFYEYFTEALILPDPFEGYMLFAGDDEVEVREHCIVLRNKFGEIKVISYKNFKLYYDDRPSKKRAEFLHYYTDNGG